MVVPLAARRPHFRAVWGCDLSNGPPRKTPVSPSFKANTARRCCASANFRWSQDVFAAWIWSFGINENGLQDIGGNVREAVRLVEGQRCA
jgi:hypothetical protein